MILCPWILPELECKGIKLIFITVTMKQKTGRPSLSPIQIADSYHGLLFPCRTSQGHRSSLPHFNSISSLVVLHPENSNNPV